MLPDHRDWLRGSDVVAGTPIVIPRGSLEVFLDDLLPPRQSVTPAHQRIISDRECEERQTACSIRSDLVMLLTLQHSSLIRFGIVLALDAHLRSMSN